MRKGKITVYYDGACPVCVRDRHIYENFAGNRREDVSWFDITDQQERLRQLGIDPRRALTELHVTDEVGRVYSELDAYILLLRRMPLLMPLAWLIGLPIIRPGLARIYRWMVLRRLRRSGRI